MADPSSSFIPKRGPAPKRKRANNSRRVYIFTLVSYILMFATLLATGGMYLYKDYIEKQVDKEVAELNAEIASFSEADLQRVVDFDNRLTQATARVNNSASVVAIFDSLERATINTVRLVELALDRKKDESFSLSASIETDSFDSTIFQRGIYSNYKTVETTTVSEVDAVMDETNQVVTEEGAEPSLVTFTAELEIPLTAVPYTVAPIIQPNVVTDPVADISSKTEAVVPLEGNEESL